jgi:hypothetical protein
MTKRHSSHYHSMPETEEGDGWAEALALKAALAFFLLILGVGLLTWLANLWIHRS